MKWFSGDIVQAISLAKTRGSIFVVYCEGNDEISKQMTTLIDELEISNRLESQSFVAIKIQSDKDEYINFAKIYQLVPVPSIFFIKNGIPVKIITGTVKTVSEMSDAIDNIIKNDSSQQQPAASTSSAPEAPKTAETDVVCEGDVCYKKTKEPEASATAPKPLEAPVTAPISTEDKNETEDEKQEKIKKAMKLIEEKRIEKIKEEKRLEKERELQRRKEGQELQNLKKWQDDQEMRQIKEDRLKEKAEAKAARQRVLDQIEEDKKERVQRFATQTTPTEPKTAATPPTTPTTVPNSARIQFKKPDGESEIVTFDSGMLFSDLHLFVKNDVLNGSLKEFVLATTFPRREFTQIDFTKTLADLNLIPTAVLLIIPKRTKTFTSGPSSVLPTATDGGLLSMLGALLLGLFTPVMALFAYLKGFVNRQPEEGESPNEAGKRKRNEDILAPNDAAKKRNLDAFTQPAPGPSTQQSSSPTGTIPKSGAYKRQNPSTNIHRLHQNSDSEDEERKTWNGNSTQQL